MQIAPLRLPAREDRLHDPHYQHFSELVDDVVAAIGSSRASRFVLLGHSMGSYVAYEVARRLGMADMAQPDALIVAGASAPQLVNRKILLHELPDDEFVAEIRRRYDGLPDAIANDPNLLGLLVPMLRGDMRLVETYHYDRGDKLACDMYALGGYDDPGVSYERLSAWQELTTGDFTMRMFAGGHFFLHPPARPLTDKGEIPPTVAAVIDYLSERWGLTQ